MRGPAAIGAALGLAIGAGIILGAVLVEQLTHAAVAVLRYRPWQWGTCIDCGGSAPCAHCAEWGHR